MALCRGPRLRFARGEYLARCRCGYALQGVILPLRRVRLHRRRGAVVVLASSPASLTATSIPSNNAPPTKNPMSDLPNPAPSLSLSPQPSPTTPYIQPNFNYALRVWWAFYWPTNLASFILAWLLQIGTLHLYENTAIPAKFVLYSLQAGPYVITYTIAIFVMRYVLGKTFRNFRIALVSTDPSSPQPLPVTFSRSIRVWWTYSIAIFVMRYVLGKTFRNFRIALVSTDPSSPQPLPVTFSRSIRVWWTYSWRTLALSLLGLAFVIYPLGWFVALFQPPPALAKTIFFILGLLVNCAFSLFILYSNVLDEAFSDFRVTLLPLNPPDPLATTFPI